MLIINDEGKSRFDKLANMHEKSTGFKYLSPSSIGDFKDCAEKIVLRKQYRFSGLTTVAGSIFHSILEDLGVKIAAIMENNDMTFEESREAALNRVDLEKTYAKTVHDFTENIPMDIITGELLCREKDAPFLRSKKKLQEFFAGVMDIFISEDVLKWFLDKPIIMTEVPGYELIENALLYGIVDRVSYDDDYYYVIDYKTIWSGRSKATWDKLTHTLQGWCYKNFVENHIRISGMDPKPVKVIFKFLQISLPTDYAKINYAELKGAMFEKEMLFDDQAEAMYIQDLRTTRTLIKEGGGYIGNSKYGCGSCSYKEKCKYGGC